MHPQLHKSEMCTTALPVCGSALATRDESAVLAKGKSDVNFIAFLDVYLGQSEREQMSQRNQDSVPILSQAHTRLEPSAAEMVPSNRDRLYSTLEQQLKETLQDDEPEAMKEDRKRIYEKLDSTFLKFKEVQSLDVDVIRQKHETGWFSNGANNKRTLTEVDFDDLKELQLQLQQSKNSAIQRLSRHDQVRIEEYLKAEHRQSRSRTPRARYALSEIRHEAAAMTGSSSARKRKHHGTSAEPPAADDLADVPASSSRIQGDEKEILDSQEAYVSLTLPRAATLDEAALEGSARE